MSFATLPEAKKWYVTTFRNVLVRIWEEFVGIDSSLAGCMSGNQYNSYSRATDIQKFSPAKTGRNVSSFTPELFQSGR